MERSDEHEKAALAREPFPPTDSTLKEPGLRAALDDRRLADRRVGSSLTDQEIAGRAMRALAEDGRVDLGDGINNRITVKAEGRIVTLAGVVDCAAQRMAAEEIAKSIRGVELVQNALTIGVDRYLDDEDLSHQVREKLDSSGLEWVGSRVSHGVVRLVGTAEKLADLERAVRTAAAVKGIRDVTSNVKVRMPEHTDDVDLLSLVNQALTLNDLVVMDREVRVANGVVHISGKVQSATHRRRVREIVGNIAGVKRIKDHIEVDHDLFRDWQARTQLSTGR